MDELHEAASRATGLSDFGDDDYRVPMRVLLDSYAAEAGLTPAGVRRTRETLLATLCARLHAHEAWRRHPGYADVPISRPIFVTGLVRTGTTALHRLLCVDPRHQGLEHWLTETPQPRPPRETWPDNPGYQRTATALSARFASDPGFKGLHFMSAETVEECWRVERQSMLSVAFESVAHLPTYSRWLAEQNTTPAYLVHRETLQLIGMGDPHRRWVLKNPGHLFSLDALMSTYPDALVVQTHRDPRTIVASVSDLNRRASAGTSTVFRGEVIGRDCLDLWSRGVAGFARARRRYDPARFVDVRYEDFVADAVGVVESIYDRFGIPLDADVRGAIIASHEESRTGERRPAHRYRLADFGLTERDVDEKFADYRSEFLDVKSR